jgi:hypothetical protein
MRASATSNNARSSYYAWRRHNPVARRQPGHHALTGRLARRPDTLARRQPGHHAVTGRLARRPDTLARR